MADHDDVSVVTQVIGGESPEKKADHDETAREIIGGEEVEKTDRDASVFGNLIKKVRGSSSSSSDSDDDSSLKSKVYRLFGREKPLHKVLGGGKPADLFLWKNKKTSGGVLGGATALWVLFEVLEYHLIPLVCHASILVLAVLFLWSSATIFINKSPPRIPEVHIPEEPVLQVVSALRTEVNRGFGVLRDIASGRDLKKFLLVIVGLWVLSILGGCCSFLSLFYIGVVLLFTVPLGYDKYEDQVDAFGEKVIKEIKKQYAVFDAKVLSKIPRGLKDKKH